jgi:hypothetical protein
MCHASIATPTSRGCSSHPQLAVPLQADLLNGAAGDGVVHACVQLLALLKEM